MGDKGRWPWGHDWSDGGAQHTLKSLVPFISAVFITVPCSRWHPQQEQGGIGAFPPSGPTHPRGQWGGSQREQKLFRSRCKYRSDSQG